MGLNNEQYERICRFLDAEMNVEEMSAFEQELKADPAMRQQLNFEQSLRDGFGLNKSSMTAKESNIDKPSATIIGIKKINRNKWFSLAAAAIIILALVTFLLASHFSKKIPLSIAQQTDTPLIKKIDTLSIPKLEKTYSALTLAALFDQNFKLDTVPKSYPMFLADALSNYQNGNLSSIEKLNLSHLPELRGNDEKQATLNIGHYYKGIAFLKNNNIPQALLHLQWIANNSTDTVLKYKATWYMALANLKNNNAPEAIRLLKKVETESTYDRYKTKAKILLQALE